MKAARIVGPQRLEVLDIDIPRPQPGEVLVRMEHLSICGSDLLTYERVLPEEDYPGRIGYPCHECSGVVEESYDGLFQKGQRVISLAYSGGLVEYAAVPPHLLVPLPDSIEPHLGVMCQPVGTVIYALQRAGSVYGKRAVVLGQGPIGLIFTDLLVRGGASEVIVSDVIEHRLEVAKSLGATGTVNTRRQEIGEAVAELTKGAMADLVIDACGHSETMNDVFHAIRMQGTAIIFGMPHGEQPILFDWFTMYNKLPTILVTNSRRSNDVVPSVKAAVDLAARGGVDLSYMVTHRFTFDEVDSAFRRFAGREDGVIKVLIDV
jgi:L-iditol 2-dehydrogenase